jgi:hypothetical protein
LSRASSRLRHREIVARELLYSKIMFVTPHAPHTDKGRRLFAHELAHVIQRDLYYGGGFPQLNCKSNENELLKNMESRKAGSITRLNLIGHSNRTMFAFGGDC